MRLFIYRLIARAKGDESNFYDIFICSIAFISVIPLMFKTSYPVFSRIDSVTVFILLMDYILRWIVSDYTIKKGRKSFLIYPFTLYALIDLISLLPSLGVGGQGIRVLRMLRIFKILHYSKNFDCIINVLRREKHTLSSVLALAAAYIFLSALIIFSHEPDTFDNFLEALYWAVAALTAMGYGDTYPCTSFGRFISMISSLFGIAIIALPAGIITAGYVDELDKESTMDEKCKNK